MGKPGHLSARGAASAPDLPASRPGPRRSRRRASEVLNLNDHDDGNGNGNGNDSEEDAGGDPHSDGKLQEKDQKQQQEPQNGAREDDTVALPRTNSGKKRWGTLGRLSLRNRSSSSSLLRRENNSGTISQDGSDSTTTSASTSNSTSTSTAKASKRTSRTFTARDLKNAFKEAGSKSSEDQISHADSAARLRYTNRKILKLVDVLPPEIVAGATAREHIAAEILTTEDTYNFHLRTLVEVYMAGTREIVPTMEFKKVFSNIQVLFSFSTRFRDELAGRLAEWSTNAKLSDIFIKFCPFFRAYMEYYANYDEAVEVLVGLQQSNQPFSAFCRRELSNTPNGLGPDLQSLLVNPVQRIPRYVLLLRELQKATHRDHADIAGIDKVVVTLEELTENANLGIKESDRAKIYDQIIMSTDGIQEHMRPSRRLIHYGCFNARLDSYHIASEVTSSILNLGVEPESRPRSRTSTVGSLPDEDNASSASGLMKGSHKRRAGTLRRTRSGHHNGSDGSVALVPKMWLCRWLVLFSDMLFVLKLSDDGKRKVVEHYESLTKIWVTHGTFQDSLVVDMATKLVDSLDDSATERASFTIFLPLVSLEVCARPHPELKGNSKSSSSRQNTVDSTSEAEAAKFSRLLADSIEQVVGENDVTIRELEPVFSDDVKYSGQWFLGRPHGNGTLEIFQTPHRSRGVAGYEGEFRHGAISESGRAILTRGGDAKGTFNAGGLSGLGELRTAEDVLFEGLWSGGIRKKRGKIIWPNGDWFEGKFRHNVFAGTGKFRTKGFRVSGSWHRGHLRGEAMLKTLCGVYTGDVLHNFAHGNGKMSYRAHSQKYEGEWSHGVKHGSGVLFMGIPTDQDSVQATILKEGSFYDGEWLDDDRQGSGTEFLKLAGGLLVSYDGNWRAGAFNGSGTFSVRKRVEQERHDKKGTKRTKIKKVDIWRLEGNFFAGTPEGEATISDCGGLQYRGVFSKGRPVESMTISSSAGPVCIRIEFVGGKPAKVKYGKHDEHRLASNTDDGGETDPVRESIIDGGDDELHFNWHSEYDISTDLLHFSSSRKAARRATVSHASNAPLVPAPVIPIPQFDMI